MITITQMGWQNPRGEGVNLIRKLKYPWILTKVEIIGKGVLTNIMKYLKKERDINRSCIQN
jgi:hypothetical protein